MIHVPFVSLARQNAALRIEYHAILDRVIDSGKYIMGAEVEACEKSMAQWHGLKHGVGVASGTDACEVALRACSFGESSVISTPAFGAVPTINAIEAAECIPVLVDVDPVTRGVTFETLSKVKADGAVVVHMFGHPCDVPEDAIEDCAHAQGARTGKRLVGTLGRVGALSFFPTKCLGNMGDGGMLVTNDAEVADRARAVRHYGGLLDGDVSQRGQNSRLSELDAAIVREKLGFLAHWNYRRRLIADRYIAELAGRVQVPRVLPGCEPTHHVFVVESEERDRLKADLAARGVESFVHYPKALHEYSRWKHLGEAGQFPVAEKLSRTVLSLPCFPELVEREQDAVISAVRECT